jgi:hypothetical protein
MDLTLTISLYNVFAHVYVCAHVRAPCCVCPCACACVCVRVCVCVCREPNDPHEMEPPTLDEDFQLTSETAELHDATIDGLEFAGSGVDGSDAGVYGAGPDGFRVVRWEFRKSILIHAYRNTAN